MNAGNAFSEHDVSSLPAFMNIRAEHYSIPVGVVSTGIFPHIRRDTDDV